MTSIDNSHEAWEEDWNDSPQLGGMGPELEQEYGWRPSSCPADEDEDDERA